MLICATHTPLTATNELHITSAIPLIRLSSACTPLAWCTHPGHELDLLGLTCFLSLSNTGQAVLQGMLRCTRTCCGRRMGMIWWPSPG